MNGKTELSLECRCKNANEISLFALCGVVILAEEDFITSTVESSAADAVTDIRYNSTKGEIKVFKITSPVDAKALLQVKLEILIQPWVDIY